MGPIESMHFQTWHEKAGKVRPLTDPTNGLTFPDLNSGIDPNTGARGSAVRQMFQTNLIMPEPCPFISTSLPACSVSPAHEHDRSGNGSAEVPDGNGAVHWSVAGFLQLLDGAGLRGRCGTAGHLATPLELKLNSYCERKSGDHAHATRDEPPCSLDRDAPVRRACRACATGSLGAPGDSHLRARPGVRRESDLEYGVSDRSILQPASGVIRLGDPVPAALSPLYAGQLLVHGLGYFPDGKTLAVVSIASNSVALIDTHHK